MTELFFHKMPPCSVCNKEFQQVTLDKHGGICGRCVKKVEKDDSIVIVHDSDTPPKHAGKANISAALRSSVWRTYASAGSLQSHCRVCAKIIDFNDFHCGHVIAEANGGKTELDNLRPICPHCNLSMGTIHMTEFIEKNGFFQVPNEPSALSDQKWQDSNIESALQLWFTSRDTFFVMFSRMTIDTTDNYRLWLHYLARCWRLFQADKAIMLPTHIRVYMEIIGTSGANLTPRRFFIAADHELSKFRKLTETEDLTRARLLGLDKFN